jgi:hypothetical protein
MKEDHMKLFVLLRSMVGDDQKIVGIFSDEDKANDAKRVMESNKDYNEWDFWITEKIMDPCLCVACVRYA